jgi:hypothetical protein
MKGTKRMPDFANALFGYSRNREREREAGRVEGRNPREEQPTTAKQARARALRLASEANEAIKALEAAEIAELREWDQISPKPPLGYRYKRNSPAMGALATARSKAGTLRQKAEAAADLADQMETAEARRTDLERKNAAEREKIDNILAQSRRQRIAHADRMIAAWNEWVPNDALKFPATLSDDQKLELAEKGATLSKLLEPYDPIPKDIHGNYVL